MIIEMSKLAERAGKCRFIKDIMAKERKPKPSSNGAGLHKKWAVILRTGSASADSRSHSVAHIDSPWFTRREWRSSG
jgi:hypothetical protein